MKNRRRWLRFSLSRAAYERQRRIERIQWRKHRNRLPRPAHHDAATDDSKPIPLERALSIRAPSTFSLVRNPEPVAQFIAKLESRRRSGLGVLVDLSEVTQISVDGIVVLLAVLQRFQSSGTPFNGNYPKDREARRSLEQSKFFKHLFNRELGSLDGYLIGSSNSAIHTHAQKKVEASLTAGIIRDASKMIFGHSRRCTGAQTTFIELMHNTNNHSIPESQGVNLWWLTVEHDIERQVASFSFVDFGVGIFESLRSKPVSNPLFGVIDRLLERVNHGTDAEVLELVFEGELRRTVTSDSFRGKGLPSVYRALKREHISNLALITNRVYYDSNSGARMMNATFDGTLVYWELSKANRWLPDDET